MMMMMMEKRKAFSLLIIVVILLTNIMVYINRQYIRTDLESKYLELPRHKKYSEESTVREHFLMKKEPVQNIHLPLVNGVLHNHDNADASSDIPPTRNRETNVPASQMANANYWPKRRNFRPNYFLSTNNVSHSRNGTFAANDVIIYLHHNKAAGTTTKKCMVKVADSSNRRLGPVQHSLGRLKVHSTGMNPNLKHNMFMGGYAFGLCDEFNASCSYFTIVREPYERTISSYSYCRRARTDQLCAALSADKVSLREWALHQGSFLFRQLLFDPIFCRNSYDDTEYSNMTGIPHEFLRDANFASAPCWFREKVILGNAFDSAQMDVLLNYVLDNLENWFTVIGIVDEYDLSLAMLQEAYGGLPFHSSCSGNKANKSKYDFIRSKASTQSFRDDINDNIRELMADAEVRQVLQADTLIYAKALQIFEKQRTIFS